VQFLVKVYVLIAKYKSIVIMARKEERPEREKSLSSKEVKGNW